MKRALAVLLIAVTLFSGCSNATLQEDSSSKKTDISSSPVDSATGSDLEDSSDANSSQHDSSEVTTNEQLDGYEMEVYGTTMFPESGIDIPYPPFVRSVFKVCTSAQEIKEFIATTDEIGFEDGYFYAFLRLAREKGYIFEPFYNGESVFTGKTYGKYNKNGVGIKYEERLFGVGFSFDVETDKIQSERGANHCRIYYLKDEWIEDARSQPFNYHWGKPNDVMFSWEEAKENGWKRKNMTINGEEKQVYFHTYEMNTNLPVAELVYFYEDCIVNIELSCQPEEYLFGVAENIRFEKIWL